MAWMRAMPASEYQAVSVYIMKQGQRYRLEALKSWGKDWRLCSRQALPEQALCAAGRLQPALLPLQPASTCRDPPTIA